MTGMLGRAEAPDYEFRQGIVASWSSLDGSNQVYVSGALLDNLPVVEGSGVINLTAGDSVLLIRMRSTWAILGRVQAVGSGDFAAAAVSFAQDQTASVNNFATIAGTQTLTSVTLAVPPWANEALVTATCTASVLNNTAAARGLAAGALIDGTGGAFGSATSVAIALQGSSSTTRSRVIAAPASTILVEGQITTSAILAASAANQIALTATAIFRRT